MSVSWLPQSTADHFYTRLETAFGHAAPFAFLMRLRKQTMRCFVFILVGPWVFLAGFCDGASLLVVNIQLAGLIRMAIR